MNKELTAMQLLIEGIYSYVSKIPSRGVIGIVQRGLCGDIKRMAIESLKKEQEQIEKALSEGFDEGEYYDRERLMNEYFQKTTTNLNIEVNDETTNN